MHIANAAPACKGAILDRRAFKLRATIGRHPGRRQYGPVVLAVPQNDGSRADNFPTVITFEHGETATREVVQLVTNAVADGRNAILAFNSLADAFAAFRVLAVAAGWSAEMGEAA